MTTLTRLDLFHDGLLSFADLLHGSVHLALCNLLGLDLRFHNGILGMVHPVVKNQHSKYQLWPSMKTTKRQANDEYIIK